MLRGFDEQHRGRHLKATISGCVPLAPLAACAAATAADPSMRGPAPYDWNGPYFGMSIAVGLGQSRHSAAAGDLTPSFDVTGGLYGLALGYNWQAGKLLYGIETDFSVATVRGTSGYLGAPGGFIAETSAPWVAASPGRLWYVPDGRM